MDKSLFPNPIIFQPNRTLDAQGALAHVSCMCKLLADLFGRDIETDLSGDNRLGLESLFIFLGETVGQIIHLVDEEKAANK